MPDKQLTDQEKKRAALWAAYGEHLRSDPYFAPNKQWGSDDVAILAACFIEDHEKELKEWLSAKGISFECGMRDWLYQQKANYERMARVIHSGVKPRGNLTNFPACPTYDYNNDF